MVFETIIIAAVAGAMLGWNVHVMRTTGVCCPPPSADGAQASSSRSLTGGSQSRRRRKRSSSSRSRGSHDRDPETRRKARTVVGSAAGSTKRLVMDPVQEQQEEVPAPACDAGVTAAVEAVAGSINGDDDANGGLAVQ